MDPRDPLRGDAGARRQAAVRERQRLRLRLRQVVAAAAAAARPRPAGCGCGAGGGAGMQLRQRRASRQAAQRARAVRADRRLRGLRVRGLSQAEGEGPRLGRPARPDLNPDSELSQAASTAASDALVKSAPVMPGRVQRSPTSRPTRPPGTCGRASSKDHLLALSSRAARLQLRAARAGSTGA